MANIIKAEPPGGIAIDQAGAFIGSNSGLQMDQLRDFADDRLINGCIYCNCAHGSTRDHIPSKTFLDQPYPENLPVIGCCETCNQGFSKDEEYVACLIEVSIAGSTDPDKLARGSVTRTLRRSPGLRARLEGAMRQYQDRVEFDVEKDRIANVMLKLARGHAAFELSQPCREKPDFLWCGQLSGMPDETRKAFDGAHVQQIFGEVGSRGLQRMLMAEAVLKSVKSGEESKVRMVINDWVDVQEGSYRYLAIDDAGGVVIRIVVREFLACEAAWRK